MTAVAMPFERVPVVRTHSSLRRIWFVMRRHAYVMWRSPHRLFDIAFWPLMDIILWGSLGTYVARQQPGSGAGAEYLLAGILLFHVLYQVQISVSTGFMEETWSRNLLNVLTTPVTELEYVLGIAGFGMVKLVLALATLSLTALGFFGFELSSIGWGLIPIATTLIILGWAVGLFTIGLMLRYGQSAEILAWGINFVLLSISGVFNPVDALPGPLQPIAEVLPSTHAFNAVRTLLDGDPMPWDEVVAGLVGSVVALLLGIAYATWMLRVFRRRGLITRFS
jgi:ABC-2 type transport system permease protein